MIYRRIVILFLLFIVFSGRGQTNSVINGGEDVATRSLILSRPDVGWFGIWDTVSGEETSSFVFSLRDGEAIRNLDVFHNEAVAYALAFEGYAWGIAPSNSRLIKLDLHTAEQTVVLEQRNIWEYLLSPDKQHAWVIYDPPDVSRYHVSFNPSLGCVLNLETGECTGDYELWPMDRMAFFWIDSQNLLILERQSLFILNITDFEKKELPDLPQVHSMFFVRDLSWAFISSEDFPGMLMRLDLRTGEREFVNIIDDDTVYTVVSLSPSHDMIVLSWVRLDYIVDLDAGDHIVEFTDAFLSPMWLDNENLIIVQPDIPSSPKQVLRYNLQTGNSDVLLEIDGSTRISVIQ